MAGKLSSVEVCLLSAFHRQGVLGDFHTWMRTRGRASLSEVVTSPAGRARSPQQKEAGGAPEVGVLAAHGDPL